MRPQNVAQDAEPLPGPVVETAPPSSADVPDYSFLDTGRPGTVFRWDPCTPVRYRVDLADNDPRLMEAVMGAFHQLADATGLHFLDAGSSDADLVVAEVNEDSDAVLAGNTIGYARVTRAVWADGDARILSAEVLLEREYLVAVEQEPDGGRAAMGALLAHELGHTVGHGHAREPHQVMYPTLGEGSPLAYGVGHLAGLARLGAARGCLG